MKYTWLSALALTVLATTTAIAQTRTVTGKVVEVGNNAPIGSAQIQIKGTTTGTLARDDGTFTIVAPTTAITLTVRRIGFPPQDVPVAANQDNITITMARDPLKLEEIVVTGLATGMSRRNLANSVASVSADEVAKVPATSIENALQGKVAGAQIQQNTGAPGGGNRIRLRGITSLTSTANPLYVVDGVVTSDIGIAPGINRVTKASGATSIAVASQESPVNRIADLNPNDIESVEVLKGAAASAIYGSKASAGVILITTKRGRGGKPAFTLRTGAGTSSLAYKERSRHFTNIQDAYAVFAPIAGTPQRAAVDQLFDPNRQIDYEEEVFGENPLNWETSLGVSGGNEQTRYLVSGLLKYDGGVAKNTYARKQNVRVNLDQNFGKKWLATINGEVLRNNNDRGLFGNDNAGNSIYYTITKIPSWLDLRRRPDGSYPVSPFHASNPFQTIDMFQNEETVWRSITSGRLTYSAYTSDRNQVRLVGVGGFDVFNQKNFVFSPPELFFEDDDGFSGLNGLSYGQNINKNLNLNAVHVFTPGGGSFTATTSIGTQYETRDLDVSRTVSENLLSGLPNLRDGTRRDLDEQAESVEDFGMFAQHEFLWKERLLLTAGIRADRSTNNGDAGKYFYYPKASASYRFSNVIKNVIDEAKVRFAVGESGNQPTFGQKFTNLNSSSIGGIGGFTIGATAGSKELRPERQREYETGVDLAMFGNRATVELTAFERRISDLLLDRTLPPSSGLGSERFNGGLMRVRGLESSINIIPKEFAGIQWSSRINFALNRAKIMELPVPPFLFSTAQVGAVRIEKGKSPTQLIGNDTVSVAGKTPDGRDSVGLKVGQVVPVVMGDGNPDYTVGFGNDFKWKALSAYVLIDRQQGGMLAAGTWRHYDLGGNSRDFDVKTETGERLGDQRVRVYRNVTRTYYQDASFTKIREVTLGARIPRSWLGKVRGVQGVTDAQISVSGRNLYWWTPYRGGDPEFTNFGAGNDNLQRNRELAAYPASRSFWVNLNLGF
jgi:TonB-dependent starch-binding outer membrane protein SusC